MIEMNSSVLTFPYGSTVECICSHNQGPSLSSILLGVQGLPQSFPKDEIHAKDNLR